MRRFVFIISDGTGITAENLGNSLLTQFENIEFIKQNFPYIDTEEKALQVQQKINSITETEHIRPLVFMTLVNPNLSQIFKQSNGCVFDLFNTFLSPLEQELQTKSSYTVGKTHGVADINAYNQRIDAVNYALAHDDGTKPRGYDKADIILIGVSRCGKTPSCLYMALQFGIHAANYPFTEEDLESLRLPDSLKVMKSKLFGLTIEPFRLSQIRQERCPNSRYASLEQCRKEVLEIEALYQREKIPFLNTTQYSIEEITTKILTTAGIKRRF